MSDNVRPLPTPGKEPLVPCESLRPGDAVLVECEWRLIERVEDRGTYVYLFTDSGDYVALKGARRRARAGGEPPEGSVA